VHPNSIGDITQNERSQRLDTETEEAVLLSHDFGCYFEDGGRSLVQRFDKPVRSMQPFG